MNDKMSNETTFPSSLPIDRSLGDRESVTDALYRSVTAFDLADQTLLESALTRDCVFDLDGFILNGLDEIIRKCYLPVSKLDTTHFTTNTRVHFLDGYTAQLTCSTLAQHFPAGQGRSANSQHFLGGTMYWIDLRKDPAGVWKISRWKLRVVWSQGDRSIMSSS